MLLLHIVTKWEPVSYNELTIGVPKESEFGEKRVSQSPESVKLLSSKGILCLWFIGNVQVHHQSMPDCTFIHLTTLYCTYELNNKFIF